MEKQGLRSGGEVGRWGGIGNARLKDAGRTSNRFVPIYLSSSVAILILTMWYRKKR